MSHHCQAAWAKTFRAKYWWSSQLWRNYKWIPKPCSQWKVLILYNWYVVWFWSLSLWLIWLILINSWWKEWGNFSSTCSWSFSTSKQSWTSKHFWCEVSISCRPGNWGGWWIWSTWSCFRYTNSCISACLLMSMFLCCTVLHSPSLASEILLHMLRWSCLIRGVLAGVLIHVGLKFARWSLN
jgi:hypothetical protein